jgi:hypothetical protein
MVDGREEEGILFFFLIFSDKRGKKKEEGRPSNLPFIFKTLWRTTRCVGAVNCLGKIARQKSKRGK